VTSRRGGLLGAAAVVALVAAFLAWAATVERPVDLQGRRTVLCVVTNPAAGPLTRAVDRLVRREPELARRVRFRIRTPASAPADDGPPAADLALVEVLDAEWTAAHANYLAGPDAPPTALAVGPTRAGSLPADLDRSETADAYWANGSPAQLEHLLRFVLRRYLGEADLAVAPPRAPLERGLVALGPDDDVLCATWDEWARAVEPPPDRPVVAILEFPTRARRGELGVAREIARACRAAGLTPAVCFGHPPGEAVAALLSDPAGEPRVGAVIALQLKFADPAAAPALEALGVPVLNAITVYGRTLEEWRGSPQGLTTGEVAWQLAVPELAGAAPHTVVGGRRVGARGAVETVAVPERARRIAARARRWVDLQETPPASRRVAVLYWNYPPGKQNVGASYLNVARSLPRLVRRLRDEGYRTGDPPEGLADLGWLERRVVARGRNVARWAPGELDDLVATGDVELVPLERYVAWFAELPAEFRTAVVDHWGPPESADIMTVEVEGELCFVLPTVRLGDVVLLPQPDRARTQDLAALYQSQDLPPHHQYVACYLWLQHGFAADAVVHTGTHGTHEWLSGKEAGLSGADPGEVLAGDLPILYPYIVDDVGEGIVAKRRGAAVVVDHLTPALGTAGLAPELEALRRGLLEWRRVRGTGPEAGRAAAAEVEAEVDRRGLALDLADRGWAAPRDPDPTARLTALEDYLETVRVQSVPFGLHTFGVSPVGSRLAAFVDLVAEARPEADRADVRADLAASGPAELASLLGGLGGGYVRPGPGNDPIRDLEAIPTGKDFHAFDPREVPTPRAWATGRRLAEELVADLRAEGGAWPEKVALQVWGVETIRHAGVQEAQALALLGVRPVHDPRTGRVDGLERIPRAELGRPRVDVVVHATSLYRDTFPALIELLDEAVALASEAPEPDNPIRAHAAALAEELVAAGLDPAEARRRARIRIFAEPTGRHDSKVAWMASASGSWDTEAQFADNYIRRMGHGYGGGTWGQPMEAEFRAALAGTEAIVHTRSSKLYMTLDNDDYFSYGGSIAIGVRRVDGGASPPFLVTDLRTPGEERHVPLERFMGQELRSRYLNPEFVRAMRDEGYAGARHVWKATEYLWGWQVVYPEAVDGARWQELHEVWVEDRYDLELEAFFEESNPHARQGIAARMLEAIRKGYWDAPEATERRLVEVYVEEVAERGVACDHLTCDDPDLQVFVRERAAAYGLDPAQVARWIAEVERATRKTIDEAYAERQAAKERWHRPPARVEPAEAPERPAGPEPVEGRVLEEVAPPTPPAEPAPGPAPLAALALLLAVAAAGAAVEARS